MGNLGFKCSGDEGDEIPDKVKQSGIFQFPKVHTKAQDICKLARTIKQLRKSPVCTIPFCSTVECEALGGIVNLGDNEVGPRVGRFAYKDIEQLKGIKRMDLDSGRISEVLDAAEMLRKEGETVCLNVSGPFTIISSMIEPVTFYKSLRKDRATIDEVLKIVESQILSYILESAGRGVSIISYGDPSGTDDIIGPKAYTDFSGKSTYNILKSLGSNEETKDLLVHVCGKTSTSLERNSFIASDSVKLNGCKSYGEGIVNILRKRGDIRLIGHNCIKRMSARLNTAAIWKLNLLEESQPLYYKPGHEKV